MHRILVKILNKIYYRFFSIYSKILNVSLKYFKDESLERERADIIVSCTTIPSRLDKINLMLRSLLNQTITPKLIVIYASVEDFPEKDIEKNIINSDLIKVIYKEENLKSHKKYIYSFLEFNNSPVITVDDDIIYPSRMIEKLLASYNKYPNAISCMRCHRIKFSGNEILPYHMWDYEYAFDMKPSHLNFLTSGGGTLFPPNCLIDVAFDKDLIKELSFTADDVWLNFMAYLSKVKVVKATFWKGTPVVINDTQEVSLLSENVNNGKNDIYIQNLISYFHSDWLKRGENND